MECKKCGSTSFRESKRNSVEYWSAFVIPFRPYRCESCDHRFWGKIDPVFETKRLIAWAVIFVLLLVYALFGITIKTPIEESETKTAEVSEPAASNPNASTVDGENGNPEAIPAGTEETAVNSDQPPVESEEEVVAEEIAPVEAVTPTNPSDYSDLSRNKLAENMEKKGLTVPPDLARPSEKQTRAASSDSSTSRDPAPKKTSLNASGRTLNLKSLDAVQSGAVLVVSLKTGGRAPEPVIRRFDQRLVLDFPGRWRLGTPIGARSFDAHPVIQRVRTGLHEDYLRLVFDIREGASWPSPDVEILDDRVDIRF